MREKKMEMAWTYSNDQQILQLVELNLLKWQGRVRPKKKNNLFYLNTTNDTALCRVNLMLKFMQSTPKQRGQTWLDNDGSKFDYLN